MVKKARSRSAAAAPVFKPTPHMPQSPVVTVLFKGLVVIGMDEDKKTGLIGLHRLTDDHYLIIEIRGKRDDGTDFLVARHVGPLSGADMTIAIDPLTDTGVLAFEPGAKNFNRASSTNDERDFRWKVDMHDPEFFHKSLKLSMFLPGVEPCIYLSDGVLHTAKLTPPINAQAQPPDGTTPKSLSRFAAVIGAAIELDESQRVLVKWIAGGTPHVLPRPMDPSGTTYSISVRNEPPAISLPSSVSHEELDHYYEVLRKKNDGTVVPRSERYKLSVTSERGTDEIPCMPTVLGP